jgi:hypothetical protein
MIKGLMGGRGIVVNNGTPSSIYISPGAQSSGMMRYNPNMNNVEVYDGLSWQTLTTNYPNVELSYDVIEVINWASEKMKHEKKIKELAEQHLAVADAVAAVEHAQQQLDIVATLCTKN